MATPLGAALGTAVGALDIVLCLLVLGRAA
jgi:hypothetical protein